MKRVWSVLLAIWMLGILALGQELPPVKLGAVVPLGDITGHQASRAMQLAVEEINAKGGILGRPLELIVIDDEMNPAKGAAAIDLLATVHNVDFFIGGMASGVHYAQVPRLKVYEKITLWIGAAASVLEPLLEGCDWYFHLHPWDYLQGLSYVEGWAAIQEKYGITIKRAFWAYEEGAFGTTSYQGSLVAFAHWENQGMSFKSAAFGGGDYRAVLRFAKDFNPDIFIWIGYDADAIPIMEQAFEIGFEPPIFVGSPPGWPRDFGKHPLSENIMLYGMWAPSIKDVSPVSKHFWDAYVARWNEEPATYFAPLGYTNVYVIYEAINQAVARAKPEEREAVIAALQALDKNAVIAALEAVEYESPLGEILTFSPSNIIKHQGFRKQKILQWQKGRQEVIWPFEFATASLVYPFKCGGR